MKTALSFRILLIGIFSAVLFSCATYPRSGSQALVGNWTNPLGTVWTLRSNETFDVDLDHDGKRDVWGTFTVADKKITIAGTGGNIPKGCKGDGIYRFTRGMNTLRFALVHDNCKLRVKNVLLVWRRK